MPPVRPVIIALLTSLLAALVSPARSAAAADASRALRARMVQIMDMNGFAQPLPAMFVLIPSGWQAQGGVKWGAQFACNNGYNYDWMAISPDGLQTVGILPQDKWETTNYAGATPTPGCRNAGIASLQQYFQQTIARIRPGARMLDFRPRPDLMAKLAYLNKRTPSPMGEFRVWVESGEALFAFAQNGRDMRGVVTASAVFSLNRNTGLGNGQSMDALTGSVLPGFVTTAPNGQLNLHFAEAIRQSFVVNPTWQSVIANHNLRIQQSAAAEVAKQGRIIAETNDYINLVRKEVGDLRSKSEERIARERGNLNRGEDTYNDPNAAGGTVQLSAMYGNAWRLNDGSYVLSDDANFDPWKDLKLEGRRLERRE